MMTRKKRRMVLLLVILLILVILSAIFVILYLNTDMFKSNEVLFIKYLGTNSENIKNLETILDKTEYEQQLNNAPYNDTIEASVNYTQKIGTTEENTNNSINQIQIKIDGQTDNSNNYDYRNIKLLKNNEQVAQAEYVHSTNNYGIRFTDLFNQYLVGNNIKEIFTKIRIY